MVLSVSIFLAILASIALYFTDYESLAIFTVTLASIFIFRYILSSDMHYDRNITLLSGILALCLIASLSMLFLGSFLLSLVVVVVAYFAVMATTYGSKKHEIAA